MQTCQNRATIIFEFTLGIGVGLIGTALAARVSGNTATAYAIANKVTAMLFILLRIVEAGVTVVIVQNLGAQRRDAADAASRAVLGASRWMGIFNATMAVVFAKQFLLLLNAPSDVAIIVAPYL